MKTFPKKVYLVIGDDDCTPEEADWAETDTHELSWSSDREYNSDVGYVREDLVATEKLEAQVEVLKEIIHQNGMNGTYTVLARKKLKELLEKLK